MTKYTNLDHLLDREGPNDASPLSAAAEGQMKCFQGLHPAVPPLKKITGCVWAECSAGSCLLRQEDFPAAWSLLLAVPLPDLPSNRVHAGLCRHRSSGPGLLLLLHSVPDPDQPDKQRVVQDGQLQVFLLPAL